jgi:hypothetical protein
MPTIAEGHDIIVKILRDRGEKVWSPDPKYDAKALEVLRQRPDVYVKGRKFGYTQWLSGTALRNDNGTVNISSETIADLRGDGPFKLEELGLCDPLCKYANGDSKRYPEYYPARPRPKTCPTCGHIMEE